MKTCQIKYIILLIFAGFTLNLNCINELFVNIHIADISKLNISTLSRGFDIQSGSRKSPVSSNRINVSVTSGNILINNTRYSERVIITARSPIQINEIDYDGEIHLIVHDKNLIRVVNRINVENYLKSVISAEMGGQSPLEALKAQAVAARTITLSKIASQKHSNDGYDLCNTTHCQVYKGLTGITSTVLNAVTQTAGLILVHKGNPIEAFYSAHCGGMTECSGSVWQTRQNYLVSQPDNFCINTSLIPNWNQRSINWEVNFTKREIENLFGVSNLREVVVSKRYESTRVEAITIKASKELTVNGQYEIRNRFNLPSTLFIIIKNNDNYLFIGNGYGHGVGMCQTGAIARANAGNDFREILNFYYTDISIMEN